MTKLQQAQSWLKTLATKKEVTLPTAIQMEESGLTLWLKTRSAVIHVCGYLPAFTEFLSQQRDYVYDEATNYLITIDNDSAQS